MPLPAGFRLAAPVAVLPFLRTPLLSWRGKLRAALDLVLPARRDPADESWRRSWHAGWAARFSTAWPRR
ncbi:MAG: hypothetical protein U0470_08075 [Anaerolineae bacterium]